mmetsp:Transcript_12336/g.40534  ORF Transcript_12336/g.40534 Transcript_12336/m.40534 type:complete len:381 (+) Transcript_12336:160-1302(+)
MALHGAVGGGGELLDAREDVVDATARLSFAHLLALPLVVVKDANQELLVLSVGLQVEGALPFRVDGCFDDGSALHALLVLKRTREQGDGKRVRGAREICTRKVARLEDAHLQGSSRPHSPLGHAAHERVVEIDNRNVHRRGVLEQVPSDAVQAPTHQSFEARHVGKVDRGQIRRRLPAHAAIHLRRAQDGQRHSADDGRARDERVEAHAKNTEELHLRKLEAHRGQRIIEKPEAPAESLIAAYFHRHLYEQVVVSARVNLNPVEQRRQLPKVAHELELKARDAQNRSHDTLAVRQLGHFLYSTRYMVPKVQLHGIDEKDFSHVREGGPRRDARVNVVRVESGTEETGELLVGEAVKKSSTRFHLLAKKREESARHGSLHL